MPTAKPFWRRFIARLQAAWRRSFWLSKDRFLTKNKNPASLSLPAIGSTAWLPRHGPSSLPGPAPPMAGFTPWKEIRQDAWAWLITWVGHGNRSPEFL